MEKENGDGGDAAAKPPPDGLLDAAGLFGAYWGRDGSGGGGAAAQAAAQAALFGFGGRYPPPNTLGVAANQAASLPLHPAASAAWWSMASHLAAQDYLARLQASGLSFPPLNDPYSALSALSSSQIKQPKGKQPSRTDRSGHRDWTEKSRSGRPSSTSSSASKEKAPSVSSSNSQSSSMRSSYGFPKTSSPSTMHAQSSLSSLASLNSLVSSPHQSKPSNKQQQQQSSRKPSSQKGSDRDLAMLRGDLMLAQAAHGAYHAAVTAAKGKNMSPLYPFGLPGSEKDRHGIDSLTGLPHTILSDPSSVLGGVRLPPDTEIIKYTSSLVGGLCGTGGSGRGRKKTVSLEPPQVSVHPAQQKTRPDTTHKTDEYGNSRSSVEVIRLPSKSDGRPGSNSVSGTPPPNLSDYAGISRELLQTIASQSGVSLAALERQLAGTTAAAGQFPPSPHPGQSIQKARKDAGLNLSTKASAREDAAAEPAKSTSSNDDDAPLNLSLKPSPPSTQASDALSRLTSLSSSLSASSANDRISRRKPGAKPRRVAPEINSSGDSPRPKSSGSEDSETVGWPTREARPRNLGRGVSKPKKNTVASLLAQSRALGLRPALAQQLLAETDLEKLKALLGETASTDSECPSDSCPSDSDASDPGRRPNDAQLRLPLALGWKRVTVIKGLSRSCSIKGDVTYTPPEPHAHVKIKSAQELHAFGEAHPLGPLSADNFSWSARTLLGEYVQPAPDGADHVLSEAEITKRLEEARALAAITGPRPTPPPVDRRIELARRQQAARDARRDASARSRDQARLVREMERSEKAELAKREKEARSQQLLEAKRKKQEEIEKQKIEDQAKRQQERELKRQQAILLKEQQKYITEERERRRQHTTFIRQLDARRRWEERERRKHQNLLDRLLAKEKKLQSRRKEMELLSELRRPQEDSSLSEQKPLPALSRIPGLKLPGQAFADLLQVYEFIHNFGQTLGFDMESLPTLNTFQLALLPDCSLEAEEELVQVLTQLLVCAIEDPGIPHPGRHTTLLGHAIRMGDITPVNLSEVLRIYLYANATGEVKALTGLTAERERERRVADHHQTEAEMQHTQANSKNAAYYEHLHNNSTYKLSEALRDKPFLALNATTKAKILAFLCDELLQNKSVLRQIDASLDHLNQLKKERYLLDMKIRKVRVLHQRKVRSEQSEKQQALALERMQRLVEESNVVNRASPQPTDDEQMSDKTETPKKEDHDHEDKAPSPYKDPPTEDDKELSPLKDLSNGVKSKELLNNNKDECSPPDNKIDKDSVMGDDVLSDLESEGTQPEEDEDKNLSSEELARKLEKLVRQSEQQLQQLSAGSHALRATCYGQDRYWRRYWSLGKCGGILVEAMESAQPEIMEYQQWLQAASERAASPPPRKKKKGPREKKEPAAEDKSEENEALKKEEALKTEMELKSIKSELNLSDHTQIIKYEPNVKHGASKVEGSIKMEEKYIQHKQTNEEELLDIEDSIPTAFLVQKPSLTNFTQDEKPEPVKETVKTEEKEEPEECKDELVNNLEELRKMAEAVSSQLDAAKKAEMEVKQEKIEEEKKEVLEVEAAHEALYTKMLEGKWFSILRHESSFLSHVNDMTDKGNEKMAVFCDNEHTCSEVVLCQGHKWDVSNNLHLLNDPSLFTLNSMVTSVQVPSNNIYLDSSLTLSGLDQDLMDSSMTRDVTMQDEVEEGSKEQDNDLEKELQADALKHDAALQKAKAHSLTSLGLLNFNALSTYVTCDSPPPIQMSPEELEQLEHCKQHGMPKKVEGSYVPKELRHGWWRITDADQLRELMEALHPRGVRERELHGSLVQHVPSVNNKLHIDKGDILTTTLSVSHLDRVIAQNGGWVGADHPGSFCAATAHRTDMRALHMVEQLEERVAAASMQVKGWRPSSLAIPEDATGPEIVARARHKLAAVEAHIERRYLKPPLVQRYASTAEATLGAVLQGEHGNSSATSPQNSDNTTEGKMDNKGIARGLATWREALARCTTSAQLAMLLQALDSAVAWDKSIMKANCQFCLCGDNEDQLLLCDGCDKGYHTYCFKPRMDKIPEGDWYCWECVNKARGERVCIVCGGASGGRTIPCALCVRAYHQDCHYPPLGKNPRGKWYCSHCIARAPPKKPRKSNKRDSKHKNNDSMEMDSMVPSPAASHASTSTTAEECSASAMPTPEKAESDKMDEVASEENNLNHHPAPPEFPDEGPPEKRRALQPAAGDGAPEPAPASAPAPAPEPAPAPRKDARKEKLSAKKLLKDLTFCKNLLCEMECHEHAWPFLIPVNTKQFPQYKKVIKSPMDLSTIRKKLQDNSYKCKEEFATDVRQIFSNCEVFNEDDSPVGRAGHNMRQFFEERWTQL
ncbi:bromodomain adjacent to zinc finger domain protein 2B-like isoform X12 [Pectinophora gossypiella]|uniref:bromodomain adjacent to zinc finger domain protein 2B-like isoform X12 n=1 Tax=Pectinophora gossypiella TaxID=13191 RepID=UPI00214E404B|nr:bromodomain adjacent to zinc finger domain protein 2B-like isoform X12 [Pectinophora gossypiella]